MPLLCDHGNLTPKLHEKKRYVNEGWLSVGRLKAELFQEKKQEGGVEDK